MKRTHPTQTIRLRRRSAPAHRLWPWEGFDDAREDVDENINRLGAGFVQDCDVKFAFFWIFLDRGLL